MSSCKGHLLFHNGIAAAKIKGDILDCVFTCFTELNPLEFSKIVDGGAGIGDIAVRYHKLLQKSLTPEALSSAWIKCYEPLPENYAVLSNRLKDYPLCSAEQVALNDVEGKFEFRVPTRLSTSTWRWAKDTSWDGFLGGAKKQEQPISTNPFKNIIKTVLRQSGILSKKLPQGVEAIEVDAVRLDSQLIDAPDFVKLDLQGGELAALQGLGNMLDEVKLVYAEMQLLWNEKTADFLESKGFEIFFDKFQIGFNPKTKHVPVSVLSQAGLEICDIHTLGVIDAPYYLKGYCNSKGNSLFDGFSLSSDTSELFKELGMRYIQTDVIAINKKHSELILKNLEELFQ